MTTIIIEKIDMVISQLIFYQFFGESLSTEVSYDEHQISQNAKKAAHKL